MRLIRTLLLALILLSIISKFSVAAYQKDMDVLTTINEVKYQDQKFAIQEEAKAKRNSIVINYVIGIFTAAFFASFFFGKKPELTDTTSK
jgi:anaerobic C4-dicarboxylate transporter